MSRSDRYPADVLASRPATARPPVPEIVVERGLVVEDPSSGFCGAVIRWENGLVVLEDRRGRRRSFPLGPGFHLDGRPIALRLPPTGRTRPRRTASGSVSGPSERAKVARAGRILVEGRHDAELVEKIWGDDLRHVAVVVELLEGVDQLADVVEELRPGPGRRLGVLVDHLVAGSKESAVSARVTAGRYGEFVLVTGHPFVDIWQAVKPSRLGLAAWPDVPRDVEWKAGISRALGRPSATQADVAGTWKMIISRVRDWSDLEPELLRSVEQLIDFVTVEEDPAADD